MKYTIEGAVMMITGPNDARCIVWAIGEWSFLYFMFVFKLKIYYMYRLLCMKYVTERGQWQ